MPLHSYLAPPPVAANPYGFPDLDSSADEFSAFVAAASAYTASNTAQPTSGTAGIYGDGGSGLWVTSSSYRYNGCSINDQGLIAFAPHSETSFYTLDTVTGTPSVFTRPEITFSGFSRWITTVWCPVTRKFFYIPDYESRYVAWHPETDVWQVFTNPAAPTAMQSSRYARWVNNSQTGPVILIYTASNTQVRVLTTSNNVVSTFSVYGAPGVSGLMNIKRWCVGPGFTSYGCTSDAVYALIYNPTGGYFYCYPITSASAIGATNYFGDAVDANTGFKLAANGKMYSFPQSYATGYDQYAQTYVLEFNPLNGTCVRHSMRGEPPNAIADPPTAYTADGIGLGTSTCLMAPSLMPDGRFAAPFSYNGMVVGTDGAKTPTNVSWTARGPHIWSPASGGWVQNVSLSNPGLPWGNYPSQWGNHTDGVVGADGCYYPSPQRINLSSGAYVYGGRFSSPPDNLPSAKFYASPYLT